MMGNFAPKLLKSQSFSETDTGPAGTGCNQDPNDVLKEVFDDVRRLTRYAMEIGALPESVDVANLYRIRHKLDQNESLEDEDLTNLAAYYQALEGVLGPVTANTLKATEFHETVDGNGRITRSQSRAGTYVRFLWLRTMAIVVIILAFNIVNAANGVAGDADAPLRAAIVGHALPLLKLIADYLLPFTYGALGASAFLLRDTTDRLRARIFDPVRIPENRSRFVLGALSGGAIAIFISEPSSTGTHQIGDVTITGAALGFVAGYSTDLLFNAVERITNAILPRRTESRSQGESKPSGPATAS